MLKIVINLRDL